MGDASLKRLIGLDRSGPAPPQTTAGSPLNPFTIPNAVGAVRLALVPAFLCLALIGGAPVSASAAIVFAICGAGDYADGFLARLTGQYSRLGALIDPLTDRLLAISAVIVCLRYHLLPEWALVLLLAREVIVLALARLGLGKGLELRINWPGRLSIPPLLGGLFFAMVGLATVGEVLFLTGLTLALIAAWMYLQRWLQQLSSPPSS